MRNDQRITMLATFATMSALAMSASGCRAIGDIFKAGVWVGVLVVGILVALVFGLSRLLAR